MKKIVSLVIAGVVMLSILSSCSMDKKVYSSGYHIEWNSKKNTSDKITAPSYLSDSKVDNKAQETAQIALEQVEIPVFESTAKVESDNLYASTGKSVSVPQSKAKVNRGVVAISSTSSLKTATSASEFKSIIKAQKKAIKKAAKQSASPVAGGKSQLIALLLCIFLGALGIHRFYLGYIGLGIMYLLFALIGVPLMAILIGIPIVAALGILVLIDLIRIIIGSLKPKGGSYSSTF